MQIFFNYICFSPRKFVVDKSFHSLIWMESSFFVLLRGFLNKLSKKRQDNEIQKQYGI